MELRQLRYFVVTAEEANVSRAAEHLHLSQPSLSQKLRELEAEFGFDLFERIPRRMRLLPVGETFLVAARRVLADVAQADRSTRAAHRREIGRLRVAFNIISGRQRLVGEALHHFRERWLTVKLDLVELNSSEQPEAFRKGSIDVGFLYLHGQSPEFLHHRTLRQDRGLLAVSRFHQLAKAPSVAARQLMDEPIVWLARTVNAPLHDTLLAFLHAHGIVPRFVQDAHSSCSLLNLVSVGMGVGLVVQAPGMDAPDDVRFVLVEKLDVSLQFCLAWRSADASVLIPNFNQAVDAALSNGVAETQRQQVFGIPLDGIEMCFNLPCFLGQRVESGGEGLLFVQRWKRYQLLLKAVLPDTHTIGWSASTILVGVPVRRCSVDSGGAPGGKVDLPGLRVFFQGVPPGGCPGRLGRSLSVYQCGTTAANRSQRRRIARVATRPISPMAPRRPRVAH